MPLLKEELQKIAKGIHRQTGVQQKQYLSKDFCNVVTLQFAREILMVPPIKKAIQNITMDSSLQYTTTNIEFWTIAQKYAFLVQVCQGKEFIYWANFFDVTETTVSRIYNSFGISLRLQSTKQVYVPYESWEQELHSQWYAQGISILEIAERSMRSPYTIAKHIGVDFALPREKRPPSLALYVSNNQIDVDMVIFALLQLSQGCEPCTQNYQKYIIVRNQSTTIPIVLAGLLIECVQETIKDVWSTLVHKTEYHHLVLLQQLFVCLSVEKVAQQHGISIEEVKDVCRSFDIPIESTVHTHCRYDIPFFHWEKKLIEQWKSTLSIPEIARRVQRPVEQVQNYLYPSSRIETISVHTANVCTQCRLHEITSPFEKCLSCLLHPDYPSPNTTLGLVKT